MSEMSSLLCVHERLDALFLQHRLALMEGKIDEALRLFAQYAEQLRAHKAEEEEHILPVYAARAPKSPGADVSFFQHEHRKLEEFLALFEEEFHRGGAWSAERRLKLLDKQVTFINFLLHHDLRERNALYPTMDKILTAEEKSLILARLKVRS